VIVSGRILVIALGCVTGFLLSCITAQSSALKPIDPAALQTTVDATAKELLIPGAVVLLRTPQGEFTVTYGTTLLGAKSPPRADTYFRAALFGPLRLQHTVYPALAVNTLPEPYSHGYLYGSASVAIVGSPPYSPDVQAATRAGTLLPKDYTGLNGARQLQLEVSDSYNSRFCGRL
jgi:hypothetical protein